MAVERVLDCQQAESRLIAYVDRELSGEELGEVERHLATCPNCRSRFELEMRFRRLRRRGAVQAGTVPAIRPMPGQGLLRRFTLISLVLTLLATGLTIYAMGRVVESYLLGQIALEARGRVDRLAWRLLPSDVTGGFLPPDRAAAFDATVRDRALESPIERIALWDRTGRLLYQSASTTVSVSPDLLAAITANAMQHDVVAGPTGRQLRVLVPVVRDGVVAGIFEVEQSFEPVAAHVAEMQVFAGVSVGGFSLVLYLLLFRLVRRAARDLGDEAAANARLSEAERRQAERASVAAELARLLTTSLDLEAVIRATLREVRRLVEYRRASAVLLEPDGSTVVWALGGDGALQREAPIADLATSRPGRAMESAAPVLAPDVATYPRFPDDAGLVERYGVRSVLSLPLISKERALGALNLDHEQAGAYSEADIAVLQPVAESLAAAIENARLYDATQRSSAVANALLRTAEALSRLVPLDQLLEDVAARAVELLGGDDALIFLAEDDGRRFVLRAGSGVAPEKLAAFPAKVVAPAAFEAFARLCSRSGPVVVEDVPSSPLVPGGLATWWGAASCVFVPIAIGERLEGAMVVHFNRAAHRFVAEELRLASGLAGQAAVAIANARAFETVGEVEALREVNRLRNEFVSLVTHELRNPLAGVVGFAELLAVRDYPPDQVKALAGEISREAQRLNGLVDDLLDLGRLESGRFALTIEPTNLATFAADVGTRFARTAPRHTITVEAEASPTVPADQGRLRQVLDNLVANAIRYSPDGGPVAVRVGEAAAGLAFVSVRDQGLGIAPEDLGRLFERFYRSGRKDVRAINGTGLGLAIAQAIVAAHGGTLRAESAGPGQGSTFTVELPVAMLDATPGSDPLSLAVSAA